MQLATSSAGMHRNLGCLVQQAAGSAQRGATRRSGYSGTGFELRTDAWPLVRGGEGVLMAATARAQHGSSVMSTSWQTSVNSGKSGVAGK
ncbi:hypothetical protein HD842_004700 [Massilia aurea]|uniref:Putative type VI secretion system Rhs element associated Vgr domain-containing protein n=1 Tax=Massilia aurea TaxID=373040 RepID=A0A7W9X4S0_9BURK|nr:type VI secretion system Vgr family protein [Massilia aurea]MBB6136522.1 hypothetical protein [Massilia aurea]